MTATLTVRRAGWWAGSVDGRRALAGRRRERQTVADMLRGDHGIAALLVVGEAGIGKSRLVEVVAEDVRSDIAVPTGWCMPAAEGLPLLPIIDVLRTLSERDGGRLLESPWPRSAPASCATRWRGCYRSNPAHRSRRGRSSRMPVAVGCSMRSGEFSLSGVLGNMLQ